MNAEQVTLADGSKAEVITMALCEVPHLMLRPNQLYRFVAMPGCAACAAAEAPFKVAP